MAPSKRNAAKAASLAIQSASVTNENEVPVTPRKGSKTPVPATQSSKKRKRPVDEISWSWTHERPTPEEVAEHIRTKGRNLVPWQRPRMAEKLLLCIEYECSRQGIAIPWDDIAHRFHPGSTGAGMGQHFVRIRNIMAAEGHMVPPKLPTRRDRGQVDSTIRGYIRRGVNEDGILLLRPIKYTEPLEHPTFNKADAHDLGAYEGIDETPSRKSAKIDGGKRKRSKLVIKYETVDDDKDGYLRWDDELSDSNEAGYFGDEDRPRTGVTEDNNSDVLPDCVGDLDIEKVALNMYTRNMKPRILGKDPNHMYWVHGSAMTYKQVCARAVEIQHKYGYQDPECGRIIADHNRLGAVPPLGHFHVNNFEHPPSLYPELYRPEKGGVLNTVHSRNNLVRLQDISGNNDSGYTSFDQASPTTPRKHIGSGFFASEGNPAIKASPSNGDALTFNSPIAYNPGGRRSFANDYKSSRMYKSAADCKAENDDLHADPFDNMVLQGDIRNSPKSGDDRVTFTDATSEVVQGGFDAGAYARQHVAAVSGTHVENPFASTQPTRTTGHVSSVSASCAEGNRMSSIRGTSSDNPMALDSPEPFVPMQPTKTFEEEYGDMVQLDMDDTDSE
ncbi:hypothetical protein GE09DRAFT_1234777 [Coniochaeta sp. 2T2.1]|nr:hypothetical protein GE09DRAFT_1234777 [Coniochaeta sp. 2T2.1]